MIRKFFKRLRRILNFPFRLIARTFLAFQRFINYEPDDSPLGDVFVQSFEQPSLLIDHIEALRKHLLRSLVALVIAVLISTTFAGTILDWLTEPVGGIESLQAIEVTESIGAFMRVTLLTGFAIALPYISVEIFAFIHPGLRRRERVLILIAIPVGTVLFLLGMAFAYFVMLPVALPFMLNFLGITTVPRPSNYIQFVTGVMFWIGVTFQLPLVIYTLAGLGVITAQALAKGWRFAVVGIAILAAAITPTIDPVNMAIVMAPMITLYFLSIGLAALAQRGRQRRIHEAAREPT